MIRGRISEGEKNRLNLTFTQILQEHKSSRDSDLQQAQDLINKAQNFTVYTVGAMLTLPVIHDYIAIAGLLLIFNLAVGTFNKYKSRIETRLRSEVLRRWHTSGDYVSMKNYDGISHNIIVEKVRFWYLLKCKASITNAYLGFVSLIAVAAWFDLPLLLKLKAAALAAKPAISAVIGS